MKKKFKVSSKNKGLLIYLSSIKTKLPINFLKKTFAPEELEGWCWKGSNRGLPENRLLYLNVLRLRWTGKKENEAVDKTNSSTPFLNFILREISQL